MKKHLISLVSTDDSLRRLFSRKLEKDLGHTLRLFPDSEALFADTSVPDIILLDARAQEIILSEVFRELRYRKSEVPVISVIHAKDEDTCRESLRSGCFDYLEVPIDEARADRVFHHVFRIVDLRHEIGRLREEMQDRLLSTPMIAESREMKLVFRMIEQVKGKDLPVLLTGEAGTGREFVARTIHAGSSRNTKPFMAFSQASVPEDMLPGTLFGFTKDSCPGIDKRKAGLFEQAHGGTVYISEIAGFDLEVQAQLLHFLRYKQIRPVGGKQYEKVDIRLIIATAENLKELLGKSKILRELYYRLISLPIHLPPLRDRGTDIILLAETFLEQHAKKENIAVRGFTSEALEAIYHYPWPGNVRELEHTIRRALLETKGKLISLAHLPKIMQPFKDASMELKTDGRLFHDNKIVSLDQIKQQVVHRAVEIANGNMAYAARELGISRSTLYKMIEKYHIDI
ncbi:MAG: sigma-54-dependent Fis family transcriptional regulator [Bacteroidetes bacterium]|nr:sigma-54-dependent Fis family transcriptional regulator [Bacteroidota bacterium]